MAVINVYLTFDGTCKEAFDMYQSVFGGAFTNVSTFAEMPPGDSMPPIPEDEKGKMMHISLPIGEETELMGCDKVGDQPAELVQGNNFSISVNTYDKEEAVCVFEGLSQGGQVTTPLQDTFWGAHFGMLTDKYGIRWMVNCQLTEK